MGWVVQAARSADTVWYILNIVHFFWIPSFVICHLVIQFLQTFQVFSVFMFSYSVSSCFIVVVVLQHQNMCMTCVCHTCVCMYVEIYMYTQLHIHTCWGDSEDVWQIKMDGINQIYVRENSLIMYDISDL